MTTELVTTTTPHKQVRHGIADLLVYIPLVISGLQMAQNFFPHYAWIGLAVAGVSGVWKAWQKINADTSTVAALAPIDIYGAENDNH